MKDENPPAFPNSGNATWQVRPTEGMTLRDWLAGRAMALTYGGKDNPLTPEQLAEHSYQVADAMLAHRQKGQTDADA